MKNRILAIFGIVAYILSVLSTAEDLEGNPTAPIALILTSLIVTVIFYVMASIRLWHIRKIPPLLLISSAIIIAVLSMLNRIIPLLLNLFRITNVVALIWTIILLWSMGKQKNEPKDTK